jgi:formylglycine-generating enzyme required for sulfatase activity
LTRSVEVEGRTRREERMCALLGQGVRPIGPYRRVVLADQLAMDFAWVPPGVFLMGSAEGEAAPRHEVRLTRGFWMATTPVTQVQYARVVGHNPSWHRSSPGENELFEQDGPHADPRSAWRAFVQVRDRDRPVQEVTWHDAVGFLERLSQGEGKTKAEPRYRLPTEAEWEYACRAGTTTRFWCGNSEADAARMGCYNENDLWAAVHRVGRGTNPLGLSDLHGNVWEWCADRYSRTCYARSPKEDPCCKRGKPGTRVLRGGGVWIAERCQSDTRYWYDEDCSHNDIGFRVVADRL